MSDGALEKVACIAGTPVDTEMGANLLRNNGFDAFSYPSSKDPVEEMNFQVSSPENKHKKILGILDKIKSVGIDKVLVYCNSLASAVDFNKLSKETGLKIVTPFDVYAVEATKYDYLGVLSANAVATKKIEEVYLSINPKISIITIGMLPLVLSVEKKIDPAEIVKIHDLKRVCEWFANNGAEAILLGCTHFPYIYNELKKVSSVPIIEPSIEMIKLLK